MRSGNMLVIRSPKRMILTRTVQEVRSTPYSTSIQYWYRLTVLRTVLPYRKRALLCQPRLQNSDHDPLAYHDRLQLPLRSPPHLDLARRPHEELPQAGFEEPFLSHFPFPIPTINSESTIHCILVLAEGAFAAALPPIGFHRAGQLTSGHQGARLSYVFPVTKALACEIQDA